MSGTHAVVMLPRWVLLLGLVLTASVARAQPDPRTVVYIEADRTRGAGVMLSSDGLVLTSTRSMGRSGNARVTLHPSLSGGGVALGATVVARDDWFTLLMVDGQGFVSARLGSTQSLKLNDHAITLSAEDIPFQFEETSLGAVTPLANKPGVMEDLLLTSTDYRYFNVGGPLFSMDGRVLGLVQKEAGSAFRGSRVLRVEDVRAFLARAKERLPPRHMTLTGPPGMTVETEHIPAAPLPLTFTFRPGDLFTFRVSRNGARCGVFRPDTRSYEAQNQVALDASGALGGLVLDLVPPDARVEVDGADLGTGVTALPCMSEGTHKVSVTAPFHEGKSLMVTVVAGQETRSRVALRKMLGTFSLGTQPQGGEVWVDGRRLGVAPVARVPLTVGPHVVSVLFPGGARLRRVYVAEDGKHAELGVVDLPPPGAALTVEHSNADTVFIDGHDVGPIQGTVVLSPGPHVVQVRDQLGNVLTDAWEAPVGGVHAVRFQGGASRLIPLLHVLGAASLTVGVVLLSAGVLLAAGIPLGMLGLAWAGGAVLDVVHRQAWLPALALGLVTSGPALVLGAVALVPGIMAPPWELLLTDGTRAPRGPPPQPIAFAVPAGWELRPVASAYQESTRPIPDAEATTPLMPHTPAAEEP